MKKIAFSFIILLCFGCTATKKTNSTVLNGTWIPIKQEMGGTLLPNAAFEKQKLILNDSTYTVITESIDKGIVKYSSTTIDIYGKEGVNEGKHFTAIYKIENKQLIICYNLSGNGYPESFDTKNSPMCFLSVFKKE